MVDRPSNRYTLLLVAGLSIRFGVDSDILKVDGNGGQRQL